MEVYLEARCQVKEDENLFDVLERFKILGAVNDGIVGVLQV